MEKNKSEVKLYTQEKCQPCKLTKKVMAQLAIGFVEIDVQKQPEVADKLRDKGFYGTPVVESPIGDWYGFRPDKIKELGDYYEGE